MRLNSRLAITALVAAGAALLTGCYGGSQEGAGAKTDTSSKNTSRKLPAKLPDFSGQTPEADARQIVQITLQLALKTPENDKHPTIQATTGSVCGNAEGSVGACDPATGFLPSSAEGRVVIMLNPDKLKQRAAQYGAAVAQADVVGQVGAYLGFERLRREHPELLSLGIDNNNSPKEAQLFSVQICTLGRTFGGLYQKGLVDDKFVNKQALFNKDYLPKYNMGLRGKC